MAWQGDDQIQNNDDISLYNCLYNNVISKIKERFNNDVRSFNRLTVAQKNHLVSGYLHIVLDENSSDETISVADKTTHSTTGGRSEFGPDYNGFNGLAPLEAQCSSNHVGAIWGVQNSISATPVVTAPGSRSNSGTCGFHNGIEARESCDRAAVVHVKTYKKNCRCSEIFPDHNGSNSLTSSEPRCSSNHFRAIRRVKNNIRDAAFPTAPSSSSRSETHGLRDDMEIQQQIETQPSFPLNNNETIVDDMSPPAASSSQSSDTVSHSDYNVNRPPIPATRNSPMTSSSLVQGINPINLLEPWKPIKADLPEEKPIRIKETKICRNFSPTIRRPKYKMS